MNFVNHALIKLASATQRSKILTPDVLAQLLHTHYGARPDSSANALELTLAHVDVARSYGASASGRRIGADFLLVGQVQVCEDPPESSEPDPFAKFAGNPDAAPLAPGVYPFCVALLLRDTPIDLLEGLYESKELQRAISKDGHGLDDPAVKHAITVGWVVPGTAFDDESWPGSQKITGSRTRRRQQRMAQANAWLSTEGVLAILGSTSK